jgi:hypothetical protein
MKKILLRVLLGFLLFVTVVGGFCGFEFIHFKHEVRRIYNALRVGMNVREIPWPKGELGGAVCDMGAGNFFIHSKDEWHDISLGRRTLPSECRKMYFTINSIVFERARYNIEFDEQRNISNIGPLVFDDM